MRILIVSTYFPPQNSVASLRPHSWAKRWSQLGHDVTVLTTTKEGGDLDLDCRGFRTLEVDPPWLYRRANRRYRSGGGGRGWGRLLSIRSKLGICNSCRMPDLVDGWIRPAVAAATGEWDLVVSTAGPYATHIVASKVKARRWIADFRDLWVDSELFPGLWPFTWLERRLERRLMERADQITTVSAPLAAKLAHRYGEERVSVIENGFDPDDLRGIDPALAFADQLKFRIVYTGMIYQGKRDPSPLFEAISRLRDDRLELIFVGPPIAYLEGLIERYDVGRWVRCIGSVPRSVSLRMQRDANALLFLEQQESGALTGKLFEYLFANRPIWAVGVDEGHVAGRLIEEAQAGHAFGRDVDRLTAHLKLCLFGKSPKLASKSEVIGRYTRARLADQFLSIGSI